MPDNARPPVLTGGCQCGAVRYALYAAPEGVHICHCRMCQKAVGGPFAALAPVRLADFAWTRGEPRRFDSSSLAIRHYCAACGTPLTFQYGDGDWIDLTLGSFDRPEQVAPAQQYGVESRVPWFATLAGLPETTTEANMPGEQRAKLVNFQHPDHDTPFGWSPPRGQGAK